MTSGTAISVVPSTIHVTTLADDVDVEADRFPASAAWAFSGDWATRAGTMAIAAIRATQRIRRIHRQDMGKIHPF
jgi:hypothetical protein